MSNRQYEPLNFMAEKKVVQLFIKVSFGASGAPTISRGKGIKSIARVSAGKYTITFGSGATPTVDSFNGLLAASASILNATAPAAPLMYVLADNSATGSVQVQFADSSGVATDPGSGEVALVRLSLSNSAF